MSVSVVIAAFNAADVLERAVDSVLAQTLAAAEILIVDDASTDGTGALIDRLRAAHPVIVKLTLSPNVGPSAARNAALAAATGAWIAVLDADDAWRPERLERLVALAERLDCDAVADNQILHDAVAGVDVRLAFDAAWETLELSAADVLKSDIRSLSTFSHGLLKLVIRRHSLLRVGLRYDERLRYGEDFNLLAEMVFKGLRVVVTREAYYVYSTRVGEVSGESSPHSRSVPRFDLIVAAGDRLEEAYQPLITPELERLFRRRRRENLRIHADNLARQLRQAGDYPGYLRSLVVNPPLLGLLLARLPPRGVRWVRTRLGRRGQPAHLRRAVAEPPQTIVPDR